MLTKSDLQQIGNLIDKSLDKKLDIKLKPIRKDLGYLRKTVDILIDRTDREDMSLKKRVVKIEEHLQI